MGAFLLTFGVDAWHVGAFAKKTEAEAAAEALKEQAARIVNVTSKGKKAYYTDRWSLDDLPHYEPRGKISGTIREWGANYFADGLLSEYWETAFKKYHSDVTFDDHLQTSEHAISSLIFNFADIGLLGRQITWDERLAFQRQFSYQPTGVAVVTGSYDVSGWNPAIGVYVNAKNPIPHLTMKQLDGIFLAERSGAWNGLAWDKALARGADKNIHTWGELGLKGDWADKPIHVYGYNLEYHFCEEMTTHAAGGVTGLWNQSMKEYANDLSGNRLAGQSMILDLAKDPYAIAYVAGGERWKTPEVRSVALGEKEDGPFYDLNINTVRARSYPFYADVFAFINKDPAKPLDPKIKEFLRFILSREGQELVEKDGKYLPLTAEAVRAQLRSLD